MSKFIVEILENEEEAIEKEIGRLKWKTGINLTVSKIISEIVKKWAENTEKIEDIE